MVANDEHLAQSVGMAEKRALVALQRDEEVARALQARWLSESAAASGTYGELPQHSDAESDDDSSSDVPDLLDELTGITS